MHADAELATRLGGATVDIGAVLDFASSFGSIVISRAYADWSIEVNASYKKQLTERAVDLVQLFPTVRSMKNGATPISLLASRTRKTRNSAFGGASRCHHAISQAGPQ